MKYFKKHKAEIVFYLFVIVATLILCEDSKKYDRTQLEPVSSHIKK